MSHPLENTISLQNFTFNPKNHVVRSYGEDLPYKGYVYLLIGLDKDGLKGKVGQTINIEKNFNGYLSRGTLYQFSRCIEFGGNSIKEVQQLIRKKEKEILDKLKTIKGFKLNHGNEHFLIQDDAILDSLEKIFKSEVATPIPKYTYPEFNDIYFPDEVHPEQLVAGLELFNSIIKQGFTLTALKAFTQSGKTNAVLVAVVHLVQYHWAKSEGLANIIIATPLNEKEWRVQTWERIPCEFTPKHPEDRPLVRQENVMILSDLIKLVRNLETIDQPYYIFIDEYQRGTQKGQTIDKFFQKVLGVDTDSFGYNPKGFVKSLKSRNLNFVFISATDFYTEYISSLGNYRPYINTVELKPGKGYIPWQNYLNTERLQDMVELVDPKFGDLTTRFKQEFGKFLKGADPNRYILVRKGNNLEMSNLIAALRSEYKDTINILEHHGKKKLPANILKFKPDKPTFIIIKDYWRAAKTLEAKYIGLVFDRYVNNPGKQSVDTVLQGLLGRLTGYHKPWDIMIYTNRALLEEFLKNEQQVLLDLKTRQTGTIEIKWIEAGKTNKIVKAGRTLVGDKNKLRELALTEMGLNRNEAIVRLVPEQKERLKQFGFKNYREVDPDFFKSGSIDSMPDKGFCSGGNGEKSVVVWVNYDDKNPTQVKITKINYKQESGGELQAFKPGVLPYQK